VFSMMLTSSPAAHNSEAEAKTCLHELEAVIRRQAALNSQLYKLIIIYDN